MILGNGDFGGSTLVNDGQISITGTALDEVTHFVNAGTITVTGSLSSPNVITASSFTRPGLDQPGHGCKCCLPSAVQYRHHRRRRRCHARAQRDDEPWGARRHRRDPGGTLDINGTLDLGGGTLDLAAGTAFATIAGSGQIKNGTLKFDGGTLNGSMTLDAVTVLGPLAVGAAHTLDVLGGIAVETLGWRYARHHSAQRV